jgi:type II secretory pathway pseudopilin PulG
MFINSQKGFTLVETFVAMTILLVAIIAPMTIASQGLQSSFFAKERITAYYLGQDVMEYIRQTRDENILQSQNWLTGMAACEGASGCGVDRREDSIIDCGSESCVLYYDDTSLSSITGSYTHDTTGGYDQTQYTRVVEINEIIDEQELEVVVTVSWLSGYFSAQKEVVVQSRLFNTAF